MNLCVAGLGYVGAVSAACLARAGHEVVGVDLNAEKIEMIRDGIAPVIEEGLTPLIQEMVRAGRLSATVDLNLAVSQADATLITVGTPSRLNGSLDTSALERVCEDIGRALKCAAKPHTLIIRSTVLPGTTRNLLQPIIEHAAQRVCGDSLGICYNPEFMREGTSLHDFYSPPFTIIGRDHDHHGSVAAALYAAIDAPLERTTLETAELLKYACNAFHAVKISFANEIGNFAAENKLDGREVMRLLCLDRKLNISPNYLKPGFAFGGSCLPKDLRALLHRANQLDLKLPLLDALLPSNDAQLQRGLRLICNGSCSRIGLLGLTFKNGTDDLRESPNVALAEILLGKGYKLRIHDDNVALARLTGANRAFINQRLPHLTALLASIEEVLAHAETLVVCTNNPLYARAVKHSRPGQQVIDLSGLPAGCEPPEGVRGIGW